MRALRRTCSNMPASSTKESRPEEAVAVLKQYLFAVALALAGSALAQSFPSKPIRVIVPFPPGGGTDIVARTVTPKMAEILGQPFIIENRAGAGGNIGTEAVAKSPADGYTLLVASASTAINTTLFPNLPWDPTRDFAPVVLMVVNNHRRVRRTGIRGRRLSRPGRARRHAAGSRQRAQRGRAEEPGDARGSRAADRARESPGRRHAGAIRAAHQARDRQVGARDPGGQH